MVFPYHPCMLMLTKRFYFSCFFLHYYFLILCWIYYYLKFSGGIFFRLNYVIVRPAIVYGIGDKRGLSEFYFYCSSVVSILLSKSHTCIKKHWFFLRSYYYSLIIFLEKKVNIMIVASTVCLKMFPSGIVKMVYCICFH